jgi:hypothetical protein
VRKVMIMVFWGCEGMILVNAMQRRETITPDTYIRTLTELRKCFRGIRPDKNPTGFLLQHDMLGRAQVWRLRKPSQNLVGQYYPIHPTAMISKYLEPWMMQYTVWSLRLIKMSFALLVLVLGYACKALEVDGDFGME